MGGLTGCLTTVDTKHVLECSAQFRLTSIRRLASQFGMVAASILFGSVMVNVGYVLCCKQVQPRSKWPGYSRVQINVGTIVLWIERVLSSGWII